METSITMVPINKAAIIRISVSRSTSSWVACRIPAIPIRWLCLEEYLIKDILIEACHRACKNQMLMRLNLAEIHQVEGAQSERDHCLSGRNRHPSAINFSLAWDLVADRWRELKT